VARIVTYDGDLERAVAGQSVTLTFGDQIDVSPGDLISTADDPAEVADKLEAKLVWMSDQPLLPERPYLFKAQHARADGRAPALARNVKVTNGRFGPRR
jgi:bifunctional enzyme CysN/CysC